MPGLNLRRINERRYEQAWLRQHRPPTLVVWGHYAPSFISPARRPTKGDVPEAEIHLLDAAHFALDESVDEIAALRCAFLQRHGYG
jgi:hypothetical protein